VRLKASCWAFALLTVFILLGFPSLVGLPPKHAPVPVVKNWGVRAEVYVAALLVAFLTTTVLAALVVRQTRQEYLDESAKNLRELVEGTLEDHRKKSGSQDQPS
jgi:uncharacterized membrane protein (DUF485 family)